MPCKYQPALHRWTSYIEFSGSSAQGYRESNVCRRHRRRASRCVPARSRDRRRTSRIQSEKTAFEGGGKSVGRYSKNYVVRTETKVRWARCSKLAVWRFPPICALRMVPKNPGGVSLRSCQTHIVLPSNNLQSSGVEDGSGCLRPVMKTNAPSLTNS
jgi:hypothetical protein